MKDNELQSIYLDLSKLKPRKRRYVFDLLPKTMNNSPLLYISFEIYYVGSFDFGINDVTWRMVKGWVNNNIKPNKHQITFDEFMQLDHSEQFVRKLTEKELESKKSEK